MTSEALAQGIKLQSRIENRFARLMATLEREYQHLRPEFEAGGFKERVYQRLSKQLRTDPTRIVNSDDQLDPDRMNQFVQEIELATLPVRMDLWNIHAGCAYCVLAELAYEQNDKDLAWNRMTEAALYLGWVLSVTRGPDVYDHEVMKAVKSYAGRNAAKGRHKDTDAMKEAAYSYVRETGGFPSQSKAVIAIEGILRARFPNAKPLKDPEETITRWLRAMPGREIYFGTLKKGGQ